MMAHRLALEVGCWDVDGLMEELTVSQLRDWMAFWDLQREASDPKAAKKAKRKTEKTSLPALMSVWAHHPGWNKRRGPAKA